MLFGLLVLALPFLAGCPATVQYQQNMAMIDTLGLPQAQQRLRETLLRAVNPRVDAVEVTEEFVRYHLAGTTYEVRINFQDVSRTEVFSNNVVFIHGGSEQLLARPHLASAEDATTFADLMLSFARGGRGSSTGFALAQPTVPQPHQGEPQPEVNQRLPQQQRKAKLAIVQVQNQYDPAPLLSAPDTHAEKRGIVYSGVNLKVIEEREAWLSVESPLGRRGWILREWIQE
jgi:hypothetical protein